MTSNTAATNSSVPGVSQGRALVIFGIASLALMMSSIDMSVVSVGLPSIMQDLHSQLAWASWILTGAQLSQCIMMPIIGKLSDDWGRKRLFLMAVAVFTTASLAAGFATNIYMLVICRVFEGLAGGAFLPSATGIISDAFGYKRTTYIGLFASIFPIGSIIGPNVGGFLIDALSWRWTFYINVPIGVLLIILGLLIFPKGTLSTHRRRIDFRGAGMFAGAMLAILYAVTSWANNPQKVGLVTFILLPVGAGLMYLFYRHEKRASNPMIDLQLLQYRPFLAANIYNFVYGMVVFGILSFVPYYANLAYGMSAAQNGIILTPRSVAMLVMSTVCSFLLARIKYRRPMMIGTIIAAFSMILLGQGFRDLTIGGVGIHNLVILMVIMAIVGIGMGIANPAANNAILDMVPEKVASVTGMRGMFRISGGIFSTAGVVLVLSFYQDKAQGIQHVALFFAALLLCLIPVILVIPDKTPGKSQPISAH
jgi:EmrB/QacA subfamily drug resistance transporter